MSTLATRKDTLILTLVAALLGGIIGAALVSTAPADAANGDHLVAGTKNTARNSTKIISPNSTQFINTRAGRPALSLTVKPGAPPMAVNSTVRVDHLNADNIDGYTSSQLRTPYAWQTSDDVPNNVDWSAVDEVIDVPTGGGAILMSGSIEVYNAGTTPSWISCYFVVDSNVLEESAMTVHIQPGTYGICHSTGVAVRPAGPHLVRFSVNPLSQLTLHPDDATWWAIVAPG